MKVSHSEFCAVREAVVEIHAELKSDFSGPEGARLLDGELASFLADDQLQVVVGGQLPFHHVDACKQEGRSEVSASSGSALTASPFEFVGGGGAGGSLADGQVLLQRKSPPSTS